MEELFVHHKQRFRFSTEALNVHVVHNTISDPGTVHAKGDHRNATLSEAGLQLRVILRLTFFIDPGPRLAGGGINTEHRAHG